MMKSDFYLIPYSMMNFRYIKDLHVKGKTITCFEINIGEYSCDIRVEDYLRHNNITHKNIE